MRIGKNKKSTKTGKRGKGQPTKYDPRYNHIARQACIIGAVEEDIARMLDVTITTVKNWKRDHYDFFVAIKQGKDIYDVEAVESSLLKRARGYDHEVEEERATREGDILKLSKVTHIPPDVGAAIFWLCNRQPERWKQISQAKFQQMNLYQNTDSKGNGKGNGKEHPIDGEIAPGDVREILGALRESGAFDSGFSLPESKIDKGSNSKVN